MREEKRKPVAAFCGALMLFGAVAQGAVVTWTGGAGTPNWSDGANWSGGSAPARFDDVVFQPEGDLYVQLPDANTFIGTNIWFRSGRTVLAGAVRDKQFGLGVERAVISVADGASAVISNLYHSAKTDSVLEKAGGGTFEFAYKADATYRIALFDVREGTVRLTGAGGEGYKGTNVAVRAGAEIYANRYNKFNTAVNQKYTHIHLEKGSLLRFDTNSDTSFTRIGSISGEGAIAADSLSLVYVGCTRGPAGFSGTVGANVEFVLTNMLNVSGSDFRFTVGASNTLAAAYRVWASSALAFASGIGVVDIGALHVGESVALDLTDASGAPVLARIGTLSFADGAELSVSGGAIRAPLAWSPGSSSSIIFDGASVAMDAAGQSAVRAFASDGLSAKAGAGGILLRSRNVATGDSFLLRTYKPISSGVADGTDGGVAFYGQGKFIVTDPLSVTGPADLRDGLVVTTGNADFSVSPDWFGTGDFRLGGAVLDLSGNSKAGELRLGAAASFVIDGAAAIRLRTSSAYASPSVLLGPLSRTGGALFFSNEAAESYGGSPVALASSGAVSTYGDGRTRLPVFVAGSRYSDCAAYSEEGGFAAHSAYASSLSAGTDEVMAVDDDLEISASDAAAASIGGLRLAPWKKVSIADGATLHVGNGTDPAVVILNNAHIMGGGTLDFGTSEGVIVCAARGSDTDGCNIRASLAGSGGVTFVSVPQFNYRRSTLRSANAYTGGTDIHAVRVSALAAGCFGSGEVRVHGGERGGGKVSFEAEASYANAFRVGGWGMADTSAGAVSGAYGALAFQTNVTLSGPVVLERETRIGVATGCVATLSGTVSGSRLIVYRSGGTLRLSGANTHSGGTEIVDATLSAASGTSLGTGDVTVDGGTLRFENGTAATTVANRLSGSGTVALAGSGEVVFAGDASGFEGVLDIAEYGGSFSAMPPFAEITNSAAKAATIRISGGGTIAWNGTVLAGEPDRYNLSVEEGTTLDLGGGTLTVRRVLAGKELVTNGTLLETNPVTGTAVILR